MLIIDFIMEENLIASIVIGSRNFKDARPTKPVTHIVDIKEHKVTFFKELIDLIFSYI